MISSITTSLHFHLYHHIPSHSCLTWVITTASNLVFLLQLFLHTSQLWKYKQISRTKNFPRFSLWNPYYDWEAFPDLASASLSILLSCHTPLLTFPPRSWLLFPLHCFYHLKLFIYLFIYLLSVSTWSKSKLIISPPKWQREQVGAEEAKKKRIKGQD